MSTYKELDPNWMDRIVETLLLRGVASARTIEGCDEAEIAEIANGRTLPRSYCDFLRVMGRGAGKLYVGSDIFYPVVARLTEGARALLREDHAHSLVLPIDAFVFSMHQGYQFLFFRTCDGDDPPVYYYLEGEGGFQKKHRSFREFLTAASYDEW